MDVTSRSSLRDWSDSRLPPTQHGSAGLSATERPTGPEGAKVSGKFARIIPQPGTAWDTPNLYRSGEVTLVAAVPEPATILLLVAICSALTGYRSW